MNIEIYKEYMGGTLAFDSGKTFKGSAGIGFDTDPSTRYTITDYVLGVFI